MIITDRTVRYGDLYELGERAGGIEFSLVTKRVDGNLTKVLYSGDAWKNPVPFGARPVAHVHPNRVFGQETPSQSDTNILSDIYFERLLSNPSAKPEPSRIIWGAGDADNTMYYGDHGKSYIIMNAPKGNKIVY